MANMYVNNTISCDHHTDLLAPPQHLDVDRLPKNYPPSGMCDSSH